MRTILQAAHIGQAASIRVVMLPAAYSRPEDFVRQGFVEAVRARALAVDLVFAAPELPPVGRGEHQIDGRSGEHTAELQSPCNIVWRLLVEKKKTHPLHILFGCALDTA